MKKNSTSHLFASFGFRPISQEEHAIQLQKQSQEIAIIEKVSKEENEKELVKEKESIKETSIEPPTKKQRQEGVSLLTFFEKKEGPVVVVDEPKIQPKDEYCDEELPTKCWTPFSDICSGDVYVNGDKDSWCSIYVDDLNDEERKKKYEVGSKNFCLLMWSIQRKLSWCDEDGNPNPNEEQQTCLNSLSLFRDTYAHSLRHHDLSPVDVYPITIFVYEPKDKREERLYRMRTERISNASAYYQWPVEQFIPLIRSVLIVKDGCDRSPEEVRDEFLKEHKMDQKEGLLVVVVGNQIWGRIRTGRRLGWETLVLWSF